MKKMLAILGVIVMILSVCCLPVSAAATDSYTHWDTSVNSKKTVYIRDVYRSEKVITTRSLGLEESITINDIVCDDNGQIYVLTEESLIVVIDENYNKKEIIRITDEDENEIDISGAQGIYVDSEGNIIICDTSYNRVIVCDSKGVMQAEILQPESPVLPEDFNFVPTKVAKDSKGYLYVISDGAYYGALLFDREYNFLSFYGANTVEGSVLSALANFWDVLTKSDEKRGNEMKKLPYQFVDLSIDSKDFVYTCTGTAQAGSDNGQIRRLSPGGSNILEKNYGISVIDAGGFNFTEMNIAKRRGEQVKQSLIGVSTDEQGYIYGLDSIYGLIYVYDRDCNLITAFGGGKNRGNREGTFSSARALEVSNGRVFVADSLLNNITVFTLTDYGKAVLKAQGLVLDGEYSEAKPLWEEILDKDQNNRLALSALGKAAYSEGDYDTAKYYSELAMDNVTYDQAMKKEQEIFVSKNFIWIALIVVGAIVGIVFLINVSKKKKIVFVKDEKTRIMLTASIHPFDNFNAIKYSGKGSVPLAVILTLLFFISSIINVVYTDFRFTTFDPQQYNPVFNFITSVGLVVLWSICNWAVSVLQEGKAKLKEIFIVTAYATLPIIIYNLIATVSSFWITSTSIVFLDGLNMLALILAGIVIVIGTMVVQEFSFPRFLASAILTVLFMILFVFIVFMIGMLLSQLWQFVSSIFMEVRYR